MQNLAAKVLVVGLSVVGIAHAAIIDETGGMPPGGAAPGMGAAPIGGGENRAMRTAVSLNAVQTAFDNSDPRENVVVYKYDRATTYKLRLREFMAATVVLPRGEAIDGYNLGDDTNFSFVPYSPKDKKTDGDRLDNVFSIKPTYPGADTSLTVIGRSGRLYNFYLRVDSVKSTHMPVFAAYIEDASIGAVAIGTPKAPEAGDAEPAPGVVVKPVKMTGEDAAAEAEYLRSLPMVDPAQINLNKYKLAGGDKALAPIKIFDNGYWTYFQMSSDKTLDKVKVPAIYRVVDGYDTPVNVRTEGGTIIAETTSKAWTLRSGEAHLCVRAK